MRIKIFTAKDCEELTLDVNEWIADAEEMFHIKSIKMTETDDQWSILVIFEPL